MVSLLNTDEDLEKVLDDFKSLVKQTEGIEDFKFYLFKNIKPDTYLYLRVLPNLAVGFCQMDLDNPYPKGILFETVFEMLPEEDRLEFLFCLEWFR